MPRRGGQRRGELPDTLARSSVKAQETWQKAHDSAVGTYGEGEAAHRVAFASLKHSFKKEGDRWVPKERRGPSDAQAARGPTTRVRSTDRRTAPTSGGAIDTGGQTRDELYREAQRLDIRGRSRMDKEALAVAVRERKAA